VSPGVPRPVAPGPAVPGIVGLVSVNVARPAFLGLHRGQPVTSGIAKKPVAAEWLELDWVNLEGDGQADLEVHGGEDKAVYAYPSEHLAHWSADLGQDLGPAAFGENLTTAGWTEVDVGIGDLWGWGDAVLEVCQPRWPCYKLGMHRGDPGLPARFRASGRTGWYLRVLAPGRVPVAGPLVAAERHPEGLTVLDAHETRLAGPSDPRFARLLALAPLSEEWKHSLRRLVTDR
jgi:MOSC domain-containing protein YiiM